MPPSHPQSHRPTAPAPSRLGRALGPWLLGSATLAAAVTQGCGGSVSGAPASELRAVEALERLAFVPGGRTSQDSSLDVGSDVDLLVDRFEVTWSEWEQLFPDDNPIPSAFIDIHARRANAPRPDAWATDTPVFGVTLFEAMLAAERSGMRLPTFSEWMWCAAGPRTRRWPAGQHQRGLANTVELRLDEPTPAGTFENGRTPTTGLYDMLGNVWEWTAPPIPAGAYVVANESAWEAGSGTDNQAWVLGGSYLTRERPLILDGVVFAHGTTRSHRAIDVGFRRVAEAVTYLESLPVGTPHSSLAERVRMVGRRWGAAASAALEAAASKRGAAGASSGPGWIEELLKGARS